MECIAEGVETEEQRQILENLGCNLYQGYLCGRPLELDAFETLLRDRLTSPKSGDDTGRWQSQVSLQPNRQGNSTSVPSTFEQLELLRSAFDLADDYFMLLQVIQGDEDSITDFLILEANQSACATMQQEREAIVGKTLLTIFPQMEQNGLLEIHIDAASRSTPTFINDFVYKDDTLIQVHRCYDIQILPTRGFLVVSWRDVTDRLRAARTLANSAGPISCSPTTSWRW